MDTAYPQDHFYPDRVHCTNESVRMIYNALIRAHWLEIADGFIDADLDSTDDADRPLVVAAAGIS